MAHDITVCFAGFYCRLFFYLVEVKDSGRKVGVAGGADESTGEKVSARIKVWCQLLWRQTAGVFALGLGDVKTAHHDVGH